MKHTGMAYPRRIKNKITRKTYRLLAERPQWAVYEDEASKAWLTLRPAELDHRVPLDGSMWEFELSMSGRFIPYPYGKDMVERL